MAIIIREEVTLPNGKKTKVKTYISDLSPLPGNLRRKADENDEMLKTKIREIERELEDLGLFKLKGRHGVNKLWYEFGSRLDFIDDMNLSSSARKQIWRAIYDHTEKLYDKNEPTPSTFWYNEIRYSYHIGKFDWDFVKTAGTWRDWIDFLDSTALREDHRIIEWIASLQKRESMRTDFLRILRRAISGKFRNIVTSELSDEVLYQALNEIFDDEKEAL